MAIGEGVASRVACLQCGNPPGLRRHLASTCASPMRFVRGSNMGTPIGGRRWCGLSPPFSSARGQEAFLVTPGGGMRQRNRTTDAVTRSRDAQGKHSLRPAWRFAPMSTNWARLRKRVMDALRNGGRTGGITPISCPRRYVGQSDTCGITALVDMGEPRMVRWFRKVSGSNPAASSFEADAEQVRDALERGRCLNAAAPSPRFSLQWNFQPRHARGLDFEVPPGLIDNNIVPRPATRANECNRSR